MFTTNSTLLWWTLDSVLLLVAIKLKAIKEALQWRSEWQAQAQSYIHQAELTSKLNLQCQWRGPPKTLTLGDQQYFVCDTASLSTKLLDMLKILGGHTPLAPLGYAYV